MNLLCFITYIFLGFLSFFILFILRSKYKISRLYNGIFSIFLFIIYASIFSSYGINEVVSNIFIINIFLFIFDFIFSTYIQEVDFFNKNDKNTLYYLFLIFISYFINNLYINRVEEVFLSGEDLRLIIWTLLIVFMYKFIVENDVLKKSYNTSKYLGRDNIITMYTKLRKIYLDDINISDMRLELAVYSLMIYHNSKRNSFQRKLDNILFKIDSKKRCLGIMQIESSKFISDIESIEIVTKDLKKQLGKKNSTGSIESVLSKYVGEDNLEVLEIYNTLKNFFKI